MALARIISDSVECSQELAASLEERGYAIEIVSPDAIPGHPADLELRVETSPDNVLTARVETHNGPRSASLDFVHYLNQPMPDFRRRVPEALESSPVRPPFVASSAQPAAVATEQAVPPEQTPEPACLLPAAPVVFADPTPVISTPSVDFSVTSGPSKARKRPQPSKHRNPPAVLGQWSESSFPGSTPTPSPSPCQLGSPSNSSAGTVVAAIFRSRSRSGAGGFASELGQDAPERRWRHFQRPESQSRPADASQSAPSWPRANRSDANGSVANWRRRKQAFR